MNRKYAQWLHPDIVGVYFPLEQWEPEILDISKDVGNLAIRLFSYELKRNLNFANLRESYFQVVSNSSWQMKDICLQQKLPVMMNLWMK